ncbi:MAG: tripartite tricarboxylate transporter substrate-binding protein [Propioniciclava sp.]|uniref:Bug family tripartite tricarboxylate transporter substrate binding protein n=1 Tax=Propioniciclava sp. TaxID=2038686 RepID=UPI0039E26DBA
MATKLNIKAIAGTAVVLLLAGFAVADARDTDTSGRARAALTVMAPAAAGGGWDLVARETQQALRKNKIVSTIQVSNAPGAGGTIGLSQLARMNGKPDIMMVTGTVMLGGIARGSEFSLEDSTPIARLAEDFEVIAVSADSPYQTLDDFLTAWKADPGGIPIGGGSAGGIDHLVAGEMAQAIGMDGSQLKYTPHSGGGQLTISLLSSAAGTVNVGISGFNDFRDMIEAGNIRPLAVVAPERLPGVDIPTMIELGYPEVDLVNWRGLVGAPGISEADRADLIAIVTEMVETPEWKAAVERNRWKENFLAGEEFTTFINEEQESISALLKELGLA